MTEAKRVAVVTGASSGIGKETARALLAHGYRVIGIGRHPGRIAAAEEDLRTAIPGAEIDILRADLALLKEARRAADAITTRVERIDLLVNNAGGIAKRASTTEEGNEQTFASNHLGPFLLTQRLLPLLRRAAADAPAGSVRVLVTASGAGEMIDGLDWDDLQTLKAANPGIGYCRAKLANLLFTKGLASRLASDRIVAHAMHPGVVRTNFQSYADDATQAYIARLESRDAAAGADTLIWLATAEEPGGTSGGYFFDRSPRPFPPQAEDRAAVDRLWHESEKLTASVA